MLSILLDNKTTTVISLLLNVLLIAGSLFDLKGKIVPSKKDDRPIVNVYANQGIENLIPNVDKLTPTFFKSLTTAPGRKVVLSDTNGNAIYQVFIYPSLIMTKIGGESYERAFRIGSPAIPFTIKSISKVGDFYLTFDGINDKGQYELKLMSPEGKNSRMGLDIGPIND